MSAQTQWYISISFLEAHIRRGSHRAGYGINMYFTWSSSPKAYSIPGPSFSFLQCFKSKELGLLYSVSLQFFIQYQHRSLPTGLVQHVLFGAGCLGQNMHPNSFYTRNFRIFRNTRAVIKRVGRSWACRAFLFEREALANLSFSLVVCPYGAECIWRYFRAFGDGQR